MGTSGDSLTAPAEIVQPSGIASAHFAVADDVRYAGFWIRFAAYVIDVVLVQIAAFIAGIVIGILVAIVGVATKTSPDQSSYQNAGAVAGVVAGLVYNIFFPGSGWQATPGKRLLGLHIIRTNGRRVGYGLALGRYFAYIPSSLILGIGFLMIGWTEEKQGLHDMICGTRVVHGRPRPQNLATVFE